MAARAVLIEQEDPAIGQELIRVTHEDGRTEELTLHDYDRVYALPGVYEAIVQDRLGCASPARIAAMLAAAVDDAGWERAGVRVLDIAAGNGVSGEALVSERVGGRGVYGTDIVPAAREAAIRDRPNIYDEYLTLDLLALTDEQRAHVAGLHADALTCVAPVGRGGTQVPPEAFFAAAELVSPDALVAYMHDPDGGEDLVTAAAWRELADADAEEVARERYLHRRTVNGAPIAMVGVVWRVRRTG